MYKKYAGDLSDMMILKMNPIMKAELAQRAESMQVSLSAVGRLAIADWLTNSDGGPVVRRATDETSYPGSTPG